VLLLTEIDALSVLCCRFSESYCEGEGLGGFACGGGWNIAPDGAEVAGA